MNSLASRGLDEIDQSWAPPGLRDVAAGISLCAMQQPPSLAAPELRAIAVAASVDPRTVRKVLDGRPVLALPRGRVLAELEKRGLSPSPPICRVA